MNAWERLRSALPACRHRIVATAQRIERFAAARRGRRIVTAIVSLALLAGVTGWALGLHEPGNGRPSISNRKDPLMKGRSLYGAKRYEAASAYFESKIDTNVEARFWLAKTHLAQGKEWRGCRQLRKYLEAAPRGRYASSAKRALRDC